MVFLTGFIGCQNCWLRRLDWQWSRVHSPPSCILENIQLKKERNFVDYWPLGVRGWDPRLCRMTKIATAVKHNPNTHDVAATTRTVKSLLLPSILVSEQTASHNIYYASSWQRNACDKRADTKLQLEMTSLTGNDMFAVNRRGIAVEHKPLTKRSQIGGLA